MAKASCPQCKATTVVSAHVCPACGFPLTPPQSVRPRQWTPKKSSLSGLAKAALVIGGVLATVLILSD